MIISSFSDSVYITHYGILSYGKNVIFLGENGMLTRQVLLWECAMRGYLILKEDILRRGWVTPAERLAWQRRCGW